MVLQGTLLERDGVVTSHERSRRRTKAFSAHAIGGLAFKASSLTNAARHEAYSVQVQRAVKPKSKVRLT